jgi:hypothetical protein
LKEKVEPRPNVPVENFEWRDGSVRAGQSSSRFSCPTDVGQAGMRNISPAEHFISQNRRLGTELNRTLSVEQQARRYESFLLDTLCRPDSYREGEQHK